MKLYFLNIYIYIYMCILKTFNEYKLPKRGGKRENLYSFFSIHYSVETNLWTKMEKKIIFFLLEIRRLKCKYTQCMCMFYECIYLWPFL